MTKLAKDKQLNNNMVEIDMPINSDSKLLVRQKLRPKITHRFIKNSSKKKSQHRIYMSVSRISLANKFASKHNIANSIHNKTDIKIDSSRLFSRSKEQHLNLTPRKKAV